MLARELRAYDVVNVGAAGTLVVRKPGSRAKFVAELRRKLPFELEVALCDGCDLIGLEMENPFGAEPPRPDVVRFVSILSKAGRGKASLPIALPEDGEWFVRIIGSKTRLVFGVYRRNTKTIGYLGQIDALFGAPATPRSWNTILSVLRILKAGSGAMLRTELLRFSGAVERDSAIDAWMKEHAGELGAVARQWFGVMRKCGDEVRELLHDGCPVACLGDAPFAYVNVFTSHVNVGFFRGASLPDPARLLQGTGKFMRHVKVRPGTATNAAALRRLIDTAYLDIKARVENG